MSLSTILTDQNEEHYLPVLVVFNIYSCIENYAFLVGFSVSGVGGSLVLPWLSLSGSKLASVT